MIIKYVREIKIDVRQNHQIFECYTWLDIATTNNNKLLSWASV